MSEIAAAARKDLFWLADDEREGRAAGTQGLDDAGRFIADRFRSLGLRPLPALGGYFQPFEFNAGSKIGPETRLSFAGAGVAADDFMAFTNSRAGGVEGPLAFVGYAITSADHDYDDFADIDVKGRVVLAMRWEPHTADGKSRWDDDGEWSAEAAVARKVDRAARAGAAGILLVNAPTHHDDAERVMSPRGTGRRPTAIPVFHLSVEAADAMLRAAGSTENLAALQKAIDDSGRPASRLFDDSRLVDANVQLVRETRGVRNVVACLPGDGPNADEYVVVGAHYDHVGRGLFGSMNSTGMGQIHNGADDNGSGTVAMLQLAQEFALAGRQDRSILFVAFTLEEVGLVGSKKFVENLPVPKDKVVAMLNLDMVGRVTNEYLYVGGGGTAEPFSSILDAADARSPIELKDMGKGGTGPSDHESFTREKIPALFLFSGLHADYHAPGDDPQKINYAGLSQVVHLAFDIVRGMCAMPRSEYIAKYDRQQPDTDVRAGESPVTTRPTIVITRGVSRVQLGVVPSMSDDETQKGVVLAGITEGSAAEKAGLKAGDIIVKMKETTIDTLYDLTGFLQNAKPGDVVSIQVLRDGETVTVEATLTARGG